MTNKPTLTLAVLDGQSVDDATESSLPAEYRTAEHLADLRTMAFDAAIAPLKQNRPLNEMLHMIFDERFNRLESNHVPPERARIYAFEAALARYMVLCFPDIVGDFERVMNTEDLTTGDTHD